MILKINIALAALFFCIATDAWALSEPLVVTGFLESDRSAAPFLGGVGFDIQGSFDVRPFEFDADPDPNVARFTLQNWDFLITFLEEPFDPIDPGSVFSAMSVNLTGSGFRGDFDEDGDLAYFTFIEDQDIVRLQLDERVEFDLDTGELRSLDLQWDADARFSMGGVSRFSASALFSALEFERFRLLTPEESSYTEFEVEKDIVWVKTMPGFPVESISVASAIMAPIPEPTGFVLFLGGAVVLRMVIPSARKQLRRRS